MHFGMSGWMKFSNDDTAYYKPQKDKGISDTEWPPKYWKFVLELEGEPKCEVAFVDPRRLGRIRLVHVDAHKMRDTPPLNQNGPDPVVDKEILTADWLAAKMQKKRVPVKAFLLDQANISGVGNWVADEILYQAKLHPEQYCQTFSNKQVKALHDALVDVCTTAVDTLAESSKFPESWLMKHRWGKGKDGGDRLPNGDRIIHLKVGGRTSAVVPSVQKKTGEVAADIDDETEEQKPKPKRGSKRSRAQVTDNEGDEAEDEKPVPVKSLKTRVKEEKKADDVKEEEKTDNKNEEDEDEKSVPKKAKLTKKKAMSKTKGGEKEAKETSEHMKDLNKDKSAKKQSRTAKVEAEDGRRRSGRLSNK